MFINWFYNVSENAEVLAAQLSSGVNANNFFLFFRKNRFGFFNLIPAFPMDGGVSLEHYYPLN
jgi:Zn-dependent protease